MARDRGAYRRERAGQPAPHQRGLPACRAEYGIPYNPDFNGARQGGIGHYQVTVRNARRSSAAVAYLRPIRDRANLTVRSGAQVLRVLLEKTRAVGVEIAAGSGTEHLRANREVIVSSGAIGSPRLLMLSGIGPADHLRAVGVDVAHDLPGRRLEPAGSPRPLRDLRVHRRPHLRFLRPPASQCLGRTSVPPVPEGARRLDIVRDGGFWYADRDARSPDIQFHLGLGSGIEAGVAKLRNDAGVTLNTAFLRPRSRGTVRLPGPDPAADAAHRPELLGGPL